MLYGPPLHPTHPYLIYNVRKKGPGGTLIDRLLTVRPIRTGNEESLRKLIALISFVIEFCAAFCSPNILP